MNIKGKLVEIFDTVQVTETFKKRELVVSTDEQYPQTLSYPLNLSKIKLIY